MAYTPTGTISMCNVPFSTDRAHTRYFTTEQEQITYFSSRVINTSLNYTFLRKDNIIRVPYNIEQIRNCNYVYYINQNFGNKIFYNFVTQVEYINENTTALHIQQDDFQTWMFNIRFLESFVEREHTNDDEKIHILEEDFSFSNYICNSNFPYFSVHNIDDWSIVVVSTSSLGKPDSNPGIYPVPDSAPTPPIIDGYITKINGLPIPYIFTIFKKSEIEYTIKDYQIYMYWMNKLGKTDSIVKVYIAPLHIFLDDVSPFLEAQGFMYPTVESMITPEIKISTVSEVDLDGYKPKNRKMFNYPFSFYKLRSISYEQEYRYEYFKNRTPEFDVQLAFGDNPKLIIRTSTYATNNYPVPPLVSNHDQIFDSIEIPIGIEIPFSKDQAAIQYALNKNYLETNKANAKRDFFTHLATGIVDVSATNMIGMPMAGTAFLTGGIGSAVSSLGSSLISSERAVTDTINTAVSDDNKRRLIESKIKDISNLPCIALGNMSDNNALAQIGRYILFGTRYTLQHDLAERADNYLSVYGYKTNKFKIPNLTGRRRWNYVKTSGINIVPNTSGIIPPSTDIENIKNIFNNGITLWHDNNIMDYGDFSNDIIA